MAATEELDPTCGDEFKKICSKYIQLVQRVLPRNSAHSDRLTSPQDLQLI